jgi:hypothetical protein
MTDNMYFLTLNTPKSVNTRLQYRFDYDPLYFPLHKYQHVPFHNSLQHIHTYTSHAGSSKSLTPPLRPSNPPSHRCTCTPETIKSAEQRHQATEKPCPTFQKPELCFFGIMHSEALFRGIQGSSLRPRAVNGTYEGWSMASACFFFFLRNGIARQGSWEMNDVSLLFLSEMALEGGI